MKRISGFTLIEPNHSVAQSPRRRGSTQAFTLIELSIVLVIIGLIAGGVLVGRDLIEAAQIRKTASQFEEVQTAVSTFRLKYNCLPGDCATAVAFGLGQSAGAGCNGDGDGLIRTNGCFAQYEEMDNFWYHLYNASLISNVTELRSNSVWGTKASLGKSNGIAFIEGSEAFPIGTLRATLFEYGFSANAACGEPFCPGLTGAQAFGIDTKVDDGLPSTGKVLAGGQVPDAYNPFYDNLTAGPAGDGVSCVNNTVSPVTYNNLNSSDIVCAISYGYRF